MAHKWIHLFMFSVPKVPDRWINPLFLLASFTWSPHLLELEWRAIHSEKSINLQLLDCWLSTPPGLGSASQGESPHASLLSRFMSPLGPWLRQESSPVAPGAPVSFPEPTVRRDVGTWELGIASRLRQGVPMWSSARWQSFQQPGPQSRSMEWIPMPLSSLISNFLASLGLKDMLLLIFL